MIGYTSVGVRCAAVPVRFNCLPEIALHRLKTHLIATPANVRDSIRARSPQRNAGIETRFVRSAMKQNESSMSLTKSF